MRRDAVIACVVLFAAALAPGCASEPGMNAPEGGVGTRGVGESCARSEDCISTLCIAVGAGRNVCTESCASDADCPGAGWACVQPERFDSTVCGCAASSGGEVCGDGIDNDCNGHVDDCRICNGTPVPADDHANCGECGHACRADEECHEAACRCTNAAAMECGGTCIDVSVSTLHCGSCTNVCHGGQLCTGGTCTCPPSATTDCSGTCVDTQNDSMHCGSCGNACHDTQYCLAGVCTCPFGGTLCGALCVDTTTTSTDCGSCGHACRADQTCGASSCRCGVGQMDCGGACVDTRTDVANCGACGNACVPGETCSASACHCASGLHCGGACISASDGMNCGACGNVCPSAEVCSFSTCRCPMSGDSYCMTSGACVSLSTDAMNCGACDNVCDPATICSASRCVCPTTGQTFCAGSGCVSLTTDPMHCGACATACAPNQMCSASGCSCPATLPNLCPTVGCVAEATDPMNCGACGNACRSGETCSSYACRCPLTSQRWCAAAGTCIDVYSDPMNCGACGNVCPTTATCSSGTCRCSTAGETVCGTSCVDLTTDTAYCGSCTRACTGSLVCSARQCTCAPPTPDAAVRLTMAASDQYDTAVAWSGSVGLVAWVDHRVSSAYRVYLIRVGPDGMPLGPELAMTGSNAHSPSVVWTGTEFGVLWTESQLHFARFAEDGTPLGTELTIPARNSLGTSFSANRVQLLYTPGLHYVAVYDGAFNIDVMPLGVDGTAPSLPVDVPGAGTPGTIDPFSAATSPSGEIGVFIESLQVVNADGSVTAPIVYPAVTGNTLMGNVALTHDGQSWVVAFLEEGTNVSLVVDRGPSLASRQIVRTTSGTSDLTDWPAWVVRGSEVVLLWRARSTFTGGFRIDGQRFMAGAAATGTLVALDVAPIPYGSTLTVYQERFGAAATTSGLVLSWGDTRWGATESYDEFFDLPPCAM